MTEPEPGDPVSSGPANPPKTPDVSAQSSEGRTSPGAAAPAPRPRHGLRYLASVLGPGLVTGAADDDPSGIATYASTGARFGYGQLWTAVWMLPMLIGLQETCGRIGNVTGEGLASVIKRRYSLRVLRSLVVLLVIANVINVGADIGAAAAAVRLVVDVPMAVLTVLFTGVVLTLEICFSYRKYADVLKWLTVSLLAYPVTAFLVAEPWGRLLHTTFVPHIALSSSFFYVLTAVIGTTITPYMFFWQTSQEVEENRSRTERRSLHDLRVDNSTGMFFSQAAAWFIIVVGATVLHSHGVTTVNSAADAAKALLPLVRTFPHSGEIAQALFALGIVSLGLLAVPVLAGASAYAISEARGWREGLDLKLRQGRQFYAVLAASLVVGLALNLFGVNPIAALVFAAVVNGIVAVPLIWVIGRIGADERFMGEKRSGIISKSVVGLTFLGVTASGVLLIFSYVRTW